MCLFGCAIVLWCGVLWCVLVCVVGYVEKLLVCVCLDVLLYWTAGYLGETYFGDTLVYVCVCVCVWGGGQALITM